MNLLQSLIYGIVSGVSSFMPVSAHGHQVLLRHIFGQNVWNPLTDLFVHLGLLAAVLLCCGNNLKAFSSALGAGRQRSRSRVRHMDRGRTYETRLIVTAGIFMLAILLCSFIGRKTESNMLLICLFFIINGVILYITDHLRQSNKDASFMSGFDGILMGLFSGFSIFPGISRVGCGMALAVGRGADKSHALNWALILSVPAIILLSLLDFIAIFSVSGLPLSFISFLGYFIGAVSAFISGYGTVMLMRFLIVNTGFAGFACYSWGMAILSFIMYLIA